MWVQSLKLGRVGDISTLPNWSFICVTYIDNSDTSDSERSTDSQLRQKVK